MLLLTGKQKEKQRKHASVNSSRLTQEKANISQTVFII